MHKLWTHPDGSLITIDGKLAYCDECPCTNDCQDAVDAAALRYEAATGAAPVYNTGISAVANIRNWLNAVAGQYHQGFDSTYPASYLSTSNNYPSTNYMPEGLSCDDVWPYINNLKYMRSGTFAVNHERLNAGSGWNIGNDTGTWKHLCLDGAPDCDTDNPTWYGYGLDEPAVYADAVAAMPEVNFISGGSGNPTATYHRAGSNYLACTYLTGGEWYSEAIYEFMHRYYLRPSALLKSATNKWIHFYTRLVIGANDIFLPVNGFVGSRDEYTLADSKFAGSLLTVDSDPIGPNAFRAVPDMPVRKTYIPGRYYTSARYGCAIDSHFAIVEWLFP